MCKERIIHTILFATALLTIFIIFRIQYDVYFLENAEENKYWVRKTFSTKTYNFVALGDSRCQYDVCPQKIEEVLSEYQCFNMGYEGCGFYKSLLKIGLARCKSEPGTIILLAITPRSLSDEKEVMDGTKIKQILTMSIEQKLWIEYFPYSYALFDRFSIKNIKASNKGIRLKNHFNGWTAVYPTKINESRSDGSYSRIFRHSNSRQGIELLSFVKKVTEKKFIVIGFFPPISKSLLVIENEKSGFYRKKFISAFIQHGGFWLNFSNKYETFDGSHLHAKSAEKFSTDLALKIKNEILKE
ncbi:hypothetical protein [Candidatus Uabimicrobium sp. HlEnr_7]|uniref:hypothetical protein n=1 Tax=Candidatus Uabimicrobium helgolandensis TaxID=3095367 RepID=UPI00355792A8